MTAGTKKPEDQNTGTADSKRSLRDDAEGKLAGVPKHSSDLKGHTPEQLIHELQVHQIELEIQAEELKKSKLALEESRDKLLDLYDFAPIGLLTVNEKETIIEVNLTCSKLLGIERSKLVRERFSKFVVPEEQDQWYWYITNLLRQEGKQCCTLRLKYAGGSVFPARLEGVRLGSGGIHTEARIAFSDITDMKKTEEALQSTNEYLNNLFDYANAPIIVWDPNYVITRFNHAFENLTHISEQNIIGQPLEVLFPKESKDRSLLQINKTLEGKRWETVEIPILVRDGSVRTVLWNSANIVSPSGRIISTIAQGVDITERKRAEEALKESEDRYRKLVELSYDGVWLLDKEFLTVYVNPAIEKMLGYSKDEMIGRSWYDFGDPEWVARAKAFEKNREEGIREPHEFLFIHKDGTKVLTRIATTPLYDKEGIFNGALGIMSDITRQKEAEEVIRESAIRFDELAEQNNTVVWEVDTKGLYTYVSHMSQTVWGYRPDELVGRQHFYDLHPESQREVFKAASFAVFEQKEPFRNLENTIQIKDGRTIWLSTNGIPLLNADGTFRGYRGSDTDITERKQIQEALMQKEERFRTLTEVSASGIWATDAEGNNTYASPQWSRITGITAADAIKNGWAKGLHPDDRDRVYNDWMQAAISQDIFMSEFRFIPPDGHVVWVLCQALPLKGNEGNVIEWIGTITDITERKQAETALLRANQKLNILTHLTRTQLSSQIFVLNGYVTMAKIYSAGQDRVIGALEKGEQVIMSINGTIASSKDYQDMGVKPPLWLNVKKTMLFGLSHLSIGKILHSLETENLEIFADPLLEKAFQHLAGNSFVHGDHVTRIRLWHTITPDGINLIFEDDGIGILQGKKEQIFLRSEDTKTPVRGLFFVHDIFEITGIIISETGEPGKGVRFEMAVPNGIWRLSGSGT